MSEYEQVVDIILSEFRQVLGDPSMRAEDNFFDFGGHSLLATRVIGNLIHKHHMSVTFQDFFKSPCAQDLAKMVSCCHQDQSDEQANANNGDNDHIFPLSATQEFLWRAYENFNFSSIYNLPFVIEFERMIDEEVVFQSLTSILDRHPSLRTVFVNIDNKVFQRIIPMSQIKMHKWFWFSHESLAVAQDEEADYQFNLYQELPLRVRFLAPHRDKAVLSLLVHHMVIDEWSLNTIMKDFKHAYFCYSQGVSPDWQNTPGGMQDFVKKQITSGFNLKHLEYWKCHLYGVNAPILLDHKPHSETAELSLDFDDCQALQNLAKSNHSSLFLVLYTIIITALCQNLKQQEIVIGTSSAGRTDPHFFDTVGYFTTMVAHRIQLSNCTTFLE